MTRSRTTWRLSVTVLAAVASLVAGQFTAASAATRLQPPAKPPQAQSASTPTDYAYDATGRLTGVTQAAGTAKYAYDANGNITSINTAAAGLAVLSVVPARAPAGATVTISGTGFDPVPTADAVTFNGAAAQVVAASPTRLTVAVPASATSGTVSVTTSAGSASAEQQFTVDAAVAPLTVSGFSPATAATGDSVTVTGTGFAATAANDIVTIGRTRARVTAASATSLTVTVPDAVSSGRVSVAAGGASATSAADLTVAPRGYGLDVIATNNLLTVDGTAVTVTIPANKVALLRFSAVRGQRLSVGFSGSTISTSYGAALFDPYGASFARDIYNAPRRAFDGGYDLPPISISGTYQLIVDPDAAGTGSVTVTLSSQLAGTLSLTGAGTQFTLTRPGQIAALTVSAQAGQYVGFGVTASTFAAGSKLVVTIREPNGAYVLASGQYPRVTFNADGSSDYGFTATQAGTYTVSVGSSEGRSGRATVTASPLLDAGALVVGTANNFTVSRPGQTIKLSYPGTINQELNLDLSNWTFKYTPYVRVFAPDGSLAYTANGAYHLDLGPLAASGTYTILISTFSSTGAGTIKLTAQSAATTISPTGPTVSVQLTAAGQTKTLSFAGTANKAYTFGFGQWGLPDGSQIHVRLLNSGSTVLAEYDIGALGIFWVTPTATGTYRLQISAKNGTDLGSVAATMSTETAGGALTAGTPVTVTATRPAQPTRYTFTGTAGQRLSLSFPSYAFAHGVYLQMFKPDGTVLRQQNLAYTQVDLDPLPATGTYQAVIRPYAETGSTNLTLVARTDAGATTVGGATTAVAISQAGQYAETSFTATANQRLDFGFTGWTFPAGTQLRIRMLNPSGAEIGDNTIATGTSIYATVSTAGTYRMIIAPTTAVAGSVSVTISEQADAGSIALNTPKTVAFDRAGASSRMTFTGTAGQYLSLNAANVTGAPVAFVRAYKPDGTALQGWTQVNGSQSLPQLPASGTYLLNVTLGSYAGSATFTLTDVGGPHKAGSQPQAARAGPVDTATAPLTPVQPAIGGAIAKRPVGQVVAPPQLASGTDSWTPDKRNLTGGSWTTNRPPLAGPTPAGLQAPPGTTALAGRLLTLDGRPLAGASASIGSVRATTDRLGRFLLAGVPAGHAVLRVDGASANSATRKFGLYDIGVDTTAKRTAVLPYPIWMSPLDTSHVVRFASPAASEVVVKTPAIPGLEVHLPKGAVVRDVYGKPVTELGITAIPVDRPPFPLPKSQVPVYFTVQPGSSYVFPTGARVVYPNYTHAAAGATMDFWHYDPTGRGWFVYGHGKVTANGQQVVPDAGTEVYQFTGAMLISPGVDAPPRVAPVPGNDFQGGDPVDLSTGVLATSQTDLTVTDTLPISVTRNYQHADTGRRDFGVGTTSAYGMYLYANQEWLDGQLILPGGGKITYHRVSAGGTGGSDYSSAAMVADPTTPSEYAGSVLVWGDDGFEVRLRDGTTFVFGNEAPLRAIRDQYGNEITITRALAPADPDGHVRPKGPITQVTSPNGKWIQFSYDSANRITGATDITGRSVSYTYDSAGHLATVTDPTGAVSTYTYDSAGRLATAKNARGVTYLTNAYDTGGRVSKQTLADGNTYEFSYLTDATGRVTETRVTDPRGTVRRVTFNAQSFGLTDTRAYGTSLAQTTAITRDTANRPVSITDQLGRRTEFTYDGNGNLASQTQLAGTAQARTESFVNDGPYDALTKHTDTLGRITTYTYAADGAPRKTTDSAGRVTNVDTNAAGQPTTVTDPLGHATTYGYVAGDLASVTDPLGGVTRQLVDGSGRRTAHIDPLGAVSSIGYDAADRPLTTTDQLGQLTRYEYDANGNLTAVTDPRSHKTTFAYDNLDRPSGTTDPLNRSSSASYDAAGHLAAATGAGGNRAEYAYDALGRMTTAQFGVTASGAQSQLTYAYDAGNRLTSVTDSATGTTTLTPDAFDRITTISSPQGQVDYAFDAADQRTSMTVASQPAVSYSYDAVGALATVKRGSDQVTIAYDPDGRRSTLTLPDGITQQYAYDAGGQLTGIDYRRGGASIGDLSYAYDRSGLVSHVGGSFARSTLPAAYGPATYDAADQLTTLGSTSYTYDPDGNRLSDGTTTYSWNARGQLAASTRGSQTTDYRYDGLDRRIGKGTTSYLYDGVTAVQEAAADGTVTASMLTGGVDEIFTRTSGGTTRSLLTDRLGSTVAVADPAGALTGEYTYSPYGDTALDGQDGGNPTRFTGREDDGNGLYYYRSRYYSTSDQRFLSPDPLGFNSGDSNLYAYVQGQPTRFADPTGMLPLESPELPKRIYLGNGRWLNKATGNIEDQAGFARGPSSGSGGGNARPEADPPAYPPIKPGSADGPTAGKPFPESVRKDVLDENPDTCVYCHLPTDRPQVDHAIPRARGGDATLDNGQTACPHCNASKGKRDFPVNPPPGYRGKWPPAWWR